MAYPSTLLVGREGTSFGDTTSSAMTLPTSASLTRTFSVGDTNVLSSTSEMASLNGMIGYGDLRCRDATKESMASVTGHCVHLLHLLTCK